MANVREIQKEASSNRILDAALYEFAAHGYQATKLEDIAKRAEITKGLIVHRFGSKYDLFVYLIKQTFVSVFSRSSAFTSLKDALIEIVKGIKLSATERNGAFDLAVAYFNSSKDLPDDSISQMIKDEFVKCKMYDLITQAIKENKIKNNDPYVTFSLFMRCSVFLTKCYEEANIAYPPDEDYLKIFDEKEKVFQENQMIKEIGVEDVGAAVILQSSMGLWTMEVEDDKPYRLYFDEKTKEMLGVPDGITPEETFVFWYSHIQDDWKDKAMETYHLMKNGSFTELRYPFNHPKKGLRYILTGGSRHKSTNMPGTRVEGYFRDVTAVVKGEIALEQNAELKQIANTLSESFDGIFYVNMVDDTYKILNATSKFKMLKLSLKGKNFFNELIENSREALYPDDYLVMRDFLDKQKIINALQDSKTYISPAYRLVVRGNLVHFRTRFIQSKEDKNHVIVAIENIEESYKKSIFVETTNEAILRNVAFGYDLLSYTQIDKENKELDVTFVNHISDEFREIDELLINEQKYGKRIDSLIQTVVCEKDKERVYAETRRDVILENLDKNGSYTVNFVADIDENNYAYQIRYSAEYNSDGAIIGFVSGVRSIESEIEEQNKLNEIEKQQIQEQTFTKLFAETYDSAFYVNLLDNSFYTYKRNGVYADRKYGFENFEESMDDFIEECVFEPDRKKMKQVSNIKYIKAQFASNNSFFVEYRDISYGKPVWYRMTVIKSSDGASAAIGLSNVNDEYLKQEENHKKLLEQVELRTKELNALNKHYEKLTEGSFELLGDIVESRVTDSDNHVKRFKKFVFALAKEVQKEDLLGRLSDHNIDLLTFASALHDIGKITIPDRIIFKKDKLTPEEWEIMKTHSQNGANLLSKMNVYWSEEYLKVATDVCLYHHERWDGNGYPKGLKGNYIPLSAQIISVVDCFDALISDRPYAKAVAPKEAIKMILEGECGAFSPLMINSIKKIKNELVAIALGKDEEIVTENKNASNIEMFDRESNEALNNNSKVNVDLSNYISLDDLTNILKELPAATFFKNQKCKYVFRSRDIIFGVEENVKGKTDAEMGVDRDFAKKAYNEDRKVVKTGKGSQYIVSREVDGNEILIEIFKRPVRNAEGKIIGIVGTATDVTERIEMETELKKYAETDILTGVGNRSSMERWLQTDLMNQVFPLGVLMIDCDRLKYVNDTFGHKTGDRYIKSTVSIMQASIPDNAKIWRWGGDEFIVIIPGCDKDDCKKYIEEMRTQNVVVKDQKVSISIGSSVMEWPEDDFKAVLERADEEMYIEKNAKHAIQKR